MTSLVADGIARLLPQASAAHLIIGEVPAAQGIADVVAVRFDTGALRVRLDGGVGPLCSPLRVRTLDLLRNRRHPGSARVRRARLQRRPPAYAIREQGSNG